jgi:hypothetical protein
MDGTMTESEAYRELDWPVKGWDGISDQNLFVLPLCGSDRSDWMVVKCTTCTMRGVSLPEAVSLECVGCGGVNEFYSEPTISE